MNLWEQQRTEVPAAYIAFKVYRDMGPRRSVEKAYQNSQSDRAGKRAPGSWGKWFKHNKWAARAAAWDAHNEKIWQDAHDIAIAETARRRADYEIKTQPLIEEQVTTLDTVIRRALEAPITETVTDEQMQSPAEPGTEGKPAIISVKTRRKGINLSGLARAVEQLIRTRREAVLGPNPEIRSAKDPQESDRASDLQARLIAAHKRLLAAKAARAVKKTPKKASAK